MSYNVTLRKLNVLIFLLFSFSISNCTGGPAALTLEHAKVQDEQNQNPEGSSPINTLSQSTKTYESSKKVSLDKQHIPNHQGHRQLENTGLNLKEKTPEGKVETNYNQENKDTEDILNEHKVGNPVDGNVHFVEEEDTTQLKHEHISDSHDKSVHMTEIEQQSKIFNQNSTKTTTPEKEIQDKMKTQGESLHHQTDKPTQSIIKHTDSNFETVPTEVSSINANEIGGGKSDSEFKTSDILSLTTIVVETVEHTDVRKRTEAVKPSVNMESSIYKTDHSDQNVNDITRVSTSPVSPRTRSIVPTTPTLLTTFTNAILTSKPTQHQKQDNGLAENNPVLMPKRPVEDQEIKDQHQNICHSGYSSEAVISGIVGGFILGCGCMIVCFYGKTRCNKYIRGDYRRVPMEYDFELNPRYKTR